MFLDMEDWSLQAIVRGSSGNFAKLVDVGMEGHDPFFSVSDGAEDHQKLVPGFLDSFPEMFDVSIGSGDGQLEELYKKFYPVGDELEELYKPFYPVQTVVNFQDAKLPQNVCTEDLMKKELESDQSACVARVTAEYSAKNKIRRKNQHKRVVVQVSAEDLSSDMWAWRKYGQKPIKGSPYPRSYYRCSSSKGCLARKQVEQSYKDPGMFIITYTAEHNHSKPTRRNSLAGTVRQKFPSPEKSTPISNTTIKEENTEELSSSTCSPKVPPQVSPSEEVGNFTDQARIKVEDKEEYEALLDTGESLKDNHVDFLMSDSVFNDDFFSGLEDFGEFISELPLCHTSSQQFHLRSCS